MSSIDHYMIAVLPTSMRSSLHIVCLNSTKFCDIHLVLPLLAFVMYVIQLAPLSRYTSFRKASLKGATDTERVEFGISDTAESLYRGWISSIF